MTRIAAHRITFNGETYRMSVIELDADGVTVRIYPLTNEIHSTIFFNGHIKVELTDGSLKVAEL
ncbi:MAG: hypothetical protein NC338_01700 [Firmicutes bacterium]|nr:hypothetical protein [Bacillota bacterium]MCM1401188.1 hypothetical protein [Bacteroides sp.]MCM1477115.1 hypothetical protein [Bacteroides sp.]